MKPQLRTYKMIKNPFLLLWLFFHLCLFSIQHEIQALEEESGILHNNNNNQMLWHIPMLDHGDDEIFQQQKRSLSDDCYIPSQQQSERAYIHALQLVEFLSRTVIPKYERKYRSNLEILLVARAGTNPRGSKVLKNFTNKGELSLSQIVTVIENELKKRPQLVSEDDYYIYNQSHNELLTQVIDLYEEKNPNQTLKFSHLGFAIRDLSEPSPYLQWKVIHMLKPCSKNNTEIFQGGLGWFFVDRPYLYATQIITLPPKIQQAVKKIITNPQWSGSLLAERYLLTAS
ncbi:MAG: DUF2145 domain-containing protein, partial [Bdellovibrionaceae bacterium]|nr:DUF2145 domain-containing protein [Pseudobdellovibrionaceae bacterium]